MIVLLFRCACAHSSKIIFLDNVTEFTYMVVLCLFTSSPLNYESNYKLTKENRDEISLWTVIIISMTHVRKWLLVKVLCYPIWQTVESNISYSELHYNCIVHVETKSSIMHVNYRSGQFTFINSFQFSMKSETLSYNTSHNY